MFWISARYQSLHRSLIVNDKLTCDSPIEAPYYATFTDLLWFYCRAEHSLTTKEDHYPLCEGCRKTGKLAKRKNNRAFAPQHEWTYCQILTLCVFDIGFCNLFVQQEGISNTLRLGYFFDFCHAIEYWPLNGWSNATSDFSVTVLVSRWLTTKINECTWLSYRGIWLLTYS